MKDLRLNWIFGILLGLAGFIFGLFRLSGPVFFGFSGASGFSILTLIFVLIVALVFAVIFGGIGVFLGFIIQKILNKFF